MDLDAPQSNNVKIENVSLDTLKMEDSVYLKPFRMHFTQNKVQRYWDFVKLLDGVAILIFNRTRDVLVFVKQFRPAVFFKSASDHDEVDWKTLDWSQVPSSNGLTLELCAGVMDKSHLSAMETAKEEVLEECGYDVPLDKFEIITRMRAGVGDTSGNITLFYVEVEDHMKVTEGGGLPSEGEFIEVVEMTIPEARDYISQKEMQSVGGFAFAISWFLLNRKLK